jgi:hypothetical protein
LAQAAYQKFSVDPSHPSLHFHELEGYEATWSVRVTLGYRAVGSIFGDTIVWFWIGTHSDFNIEFPR